MHRTYASDGPDAELEQGDILQPSDALKQILCEVHPHFCDDKYLGFLVATQSCDLALRGPTPRAPYICVASIRPLSQVIHKVLAEAVNPTFEGILPSSCKRDARQFLERLFNQNEQAAGLFYLHKDADAGIAEPAVAFLRVTVALRAGHYNTLINARVGRLTPEFRAKLGWLMGNLYARPATRDWAETREDKKSLSNFVTQYVSEGRWIDDEIIETAKGRGIDLRSADPETLEELRPPTRREKALSEVGDELRRVAPELRDEIIEKLQNRLRNSGKFARLFH